MSNEFWKYSDGGLGWGEEQLTFQHGIVDSSGCAFDAGDFVNMLQADINQHSSNLRLNQNISNFHNVKKSPTLGYLPSDGGDIGMSYGVGTIDPSIFNFNGSLPFEVPVDPTLLGVGEVSPRTIPAPLPPSPAIAPPPPSLLPIPPLSAPETPIMGHLSHAMVPTQSQMPSLISSRAPSPTPSPGIHIQDADGDTIIVADDDMDNHDVDEHLTTTTTNSAIVSTSALAAAAATPHSKNLKTIKFDSDSAAKVLPLRGIECLSTPSYEPLSADSPSAPPYETLETSLPHLRTYSALPLPLPLPQPQPQPTTQKQQQQQEPVTSSYRSQIANTTDDGKIAHLTYPHDHHVVFTCGHEDRFFTYVESHLKMCICSRISRTFTDFLITDPERSKMKGEYGTWELIGAGLEKEYVDGICELCKKKEKKEKIAAIKRKGDGRSGNGIGKVSKEGYLRSYREGGAGGAGVEMGMGSGKGKMVKNKRPYKKRKQMLEAEKLCESITLRHSKRQRT